ncbi:MAG TPA: hypothetical protein VKR43_14575 [Bryobacteraceae bacterium]|nr:hypothetical protein [Bryobacteraceae bacterium]
MDLRAYYQKIRRIEAGISEAAVVVVSRETSDGGRAGVFTDVPRSVAARMIADEKADLASEEDAAEFRASVETKWKIAQRVRV